MISYPHLNLYLYPAMLAPSIVQYLQIYPFCPHLFDIPVLVNLFLFNINTVNMLSMRISFIFLSNGQLHILSSLLGRHGSEKNIHLFQTAARSVFQEDENESAHGRAKDAKHDESAPADAVDGRGCDLCDDEIKKPLG